jgi:hypothetical protein
MPNATDNTYIKERDAAIALSTEMHKSSAQEYDKQIVYISGGALGLTLTFAKDIVTVTGSHFILLLILAWIAFAVSLLCNLISHRKATEVYSLTRTLHLYLRDCAQPNATYDKAERQKIDVKLSKANGWLVGLNKASELTIVVGIGAFIAFSAANAYLTASQPVSSLSNGAQVTNTIANTPKPPAYDSTNVKTAKSSATQQKK